MQPYEQLEKDFGAWAGVKNVVACSSGTAALHLALEAVLGPPPTGLPYCSEFQHVIVPDYSMIACARSVSLSGRMPVFADCYDHDLLIDPESIKARITPRTRAIMAVHNYGRRCDMKQIHDIASHYGLRVIEDLAEAHGIAPHHLTHAACWSFYRNKIVGGEEGGAVSFPNTNYAALARSLRCLGFTQAHDYRHIPRGHNYRLANSLATLILKSLGNVEANIALRFAQIESLNAFIPTCWRLPHRLAPWVYDLRITGMSLGDQERVIHALHDEGIAARYGFYPHSLQEEYLNQENSSFSYNPHAKRAKREVIYLPISPEASLPYSPQRAVEIICSALPRHLQP